MKTLLEHANTAQTKLAEGVNQRYKPAYHITPPAGWMNDPNGLIYFNGQYHVFYQHHPYSENWGPMHWGHAVSDDLIRWRHCPIALAPDQSYDRDGCFSGSAVVNNNELWLIYTGHQWLNAPGDDSAIREVQCLATSIDGIHFEKQGPILSPPEGIMHFRDPKVWRQDEQWWMVVGARDAQDIGQALLYRSTDLQQWQFVEIAAKAALGEGYMWECPDLFTLNGKSVLIYSPQGIEANGYRYRNRFQSGYIIGRQSDDAFFNAERPFQEMDAGHDFYAPQSFEAADGRRLIFGWMDMWESPMPSKQDGWAGALTLPRELTLDGRQRLLMNPIKELTQLRREQSQFSLTTLTDDRRSLDLQAIQSEIIVTLNLKNSNAERYGLALAAASDGSEATLLYVDNQSKRLVLDRSRSGLALKGYRSIELPKGDLLTLRIFIDHSSIEVFVNHGEACFSSRIYPQNKDYNVNLFAENGRAEFTEVTYWRLAAIFD
jgi:beta-fructofuranosidase